MSHARTESLTRTRGLARRRSEILAQEVSRELEVSRRRSRAQEVSRIDILSRCRTSHADGRRSRAGEAGGHEAGSCAQKMQVARARRWRSRAEGRWRSRAHEDGGRANWRRREDRHCARRISRERKQRKVMSY